MLPNAPKLPPRRPQEEKRPTVEHEGRDFPLTLERGEWRMRSRAKHQKVSFRTGTDRLPEAKRRAKEWLEKHSTNNPKSQRGGGSLERLAELYKEVPKRTKAEVGEGNIGRLRTVCDVALGRELEAVTCREVGPELWESYQRKALAAKKIKFDLVTRNRENIAVNSAVRAARCLFLPALVRYYQAHGLDIRPDAGQVVMLPEPYVPPAKVDDTKIVEAWAAIEAVDRRLWLTVGLARFGGLRRDEIDSCRLGWIEIRDKGVFVAMRDRPEEKWWTKTGRPYSAQIIDPALAEYLAAMKAEGPEDRFVISDPPDRDRAQWFEHFPQKWLRAHGVKAQKPLHRLRGLYADHIAKLNEDAIAARTAGVRAAQAALGHTTDTTTKDHYLSGE